MSTDIHHLAGAYALDALDDTERALFEAHYPACEVCRVDVANFRATLAKVAAAQSVAPSAQVKERVMADIARTRQLSPRLPGAADLEARRARRRRPGVAGLLAVAAALAVLIAGVAIGRSIGSDSTYDEVAAAVLGQPDVRVVDLEGTGQGRFRVAWSQQSGQAAVIGEGLGDPGDGNAYELWLIDASGPHPMQLLDPADGGDVRRVLDVAGDPAAWGVTVEPKAGSPAPTTPVIFSAAV